LSAFLPPYKTLLMPQNISLNFVKPSQGFLILIKFTKAHHLIKSKILGKFVFFLPNTVKVSFQFLKVTLHFQQNFLKD